jgi:hypothetical protein
MNGNQPRQNFGQPTSDRPQSTGSDFAQSSATDAAHGVSHSAEQLKHKASTAASQVTSKTKEAATHAKQDLSGQLYQATEKVKAVGRDYATRKKSQAVAELDIFRDAILSAANKLKDEDHDTVGCYVAAAAEQIGRLRSSLDQRNVQSLLNEAQSLTRRHPEVVYGGLFVAGVALMRFLKASSREDEAAKLAARRDTMYSSARGRNTSGAQLSGTRTTSRGLQGRAAQGSYTSGGYDRGPASEEPRETGRVQHATAQPHGVLQPAQAGRSGSVGSGQAGSSVSTAGSADSGAVRGAVASSNAATDSQSSVVHPLTASSSYHTGQSLDPPASQSSDVRVIPSVPPSNASNATNAGSEHSSATQRPSSTQRP